MDLIFQTLTSLYTRSNSPAVISSDFSHTSFLPGFQKTRVWGAGLGWVDLLSLSFLGSLACGCPTSSQGTMVALEHGRDTGTNCGWWPILSPPAYWDVFQKRAWKKGPASSSNTFFTWASCTGERGVWVHLCPLPCLSIAPHNIAILWHHTSGKRDQGRGATNLGEALF